MENENNSSTEKDSVEVNSIKKCGAFLCNFIKQSKILIEYSFAEIKKIADRIKDDYDKITKINIDTKYSYGKFEATDKIFENHNKNIYIFKNLRYDLIVRICSLYDSYLSKVIKCVMFDKSMIGLYNRELSLKEIEKFESQEELIKYCIDSKVDELFRKSHREQIEWIEKNFNIDILNSFKRREQVFLFFEMRNLIVHNDGIINRIFIENTKKSQLKNTPILGKEFIITLGDINQYTHNLFDFAIYIFSILMGKIYPKLTDCEDIDVFTISNIYDLLVEKEYDWVIQIADHCLQKNQKHTDSDRLMILLNKCIALKHLNKGQYLDIINNEDWSNCKDLFLLAKCSLTEKYSEAVTYMKRLGSGEEQLTGYVKWPLFDWFRGTKEFHLGFKEVFGTSFEDKLAQIAFEEASVFTQENENKVYITNSIIEASED